MSIISNTTVLSNFAAIDQSDLLRKLYSFLYMPTAVHDEIRRGLDEGYNFIVGGSCLRMIGLRDKSPEGGTSPYLALWDPLVLMVERNICSSNQANDILVIEMKILYNLRLKKHLFCAHCSAFSFYRGLQE